ncbi:FAD-dependent oxidoreductase [Chloroflexota bacterium]
MTRPRVIVVGGGFSGCAAAIAAAKVGAEVLLLERTDMLSGAGLRAGRIHYNGKIVATEEAKALGGGEVFEALESIILHRGNIVDEENACIYDLSRVDPAMRRAVEAAGVEVRLESRAVDVARADGSIKTVILDSGESISGDAFIDCSGGSGGIDACTKYGKGCVMCSPFRCPVFGDRVSIATKAGAPELMYVNPDGKIGGTGGGVALYKESLSPDLRKLLEAEGALTIPLPEATLDPTKEVKVGASRSRRHFENICIVNTGINGKCVGLGFMPLDTLRVVPGFENAIFEEPWGAGIYNVMGSLSMSTREHSLRVKNFRNLFVAGERAMLGGGVNEVIILGMVAGNNAVREVMEVEPLILPRDTVIGDFIAFSGELMELPPGSGQRANLGHGPYFERMKQLGLYPSDMPIIHKRIRDLGLTGILAKQVV